MLLMDLFTILQSSLSTGGSGEYAVALGFDLGGSDLRVSALLPDLGAVDLGDFGEAASALVLKSGLLMVGSGACLDVLLAGGVLD